MVLSAKILKNSVNLHLKNIYLNLFDHVLSGKKIDRIIICANSTAVLYSNMACWKIPQIPPSILMSHERSV